MKDKIKSLFSISIFSGVVIYSLYSFTNYYSNKYYLNILKDKDISTNEKIKLLIIPDYLYGKGAKSVLIKHQLESDREETRSSYYRYVNEKIKENESNIDKLSKEKSNL